MRTRVGVRGLAAAAVAGVMVLAGPVGPGTQATAHAGSQTTAHTGDGNIVLGDPSSAWWVANALANNQGQDLVELVFFERTLQQLYADNPNLPPTRALQLIEGMRTAVESNLQSLPAQQGDSVIPGFVSAVELYLSDGAAPALLEAAKTTYQYFTNQTSVANPDGSQKVTAAADLATMAVQIYTQAGLVLDGAVNMAKDDAHPLFRTAQNLIFAAQTAPTSATAQQIIEANPTLGLIRGVNALIDSNGEIRTSVEHLTDLTVSALGTVIAQQKEAQQTLQHVESLQQDILAYAKDADTRQREAAAAQAKAQREQQLLSAETAALNILSSLIGLGDPKGAKLVKAVGTATLQVANGVVQFAELATRMGGLDKAIGSMAGAALTGNIVGAVFALLPVFTGAKDPNQEILEQIGALRQQVADLGQVMSGRFDRVDRSLNTIYSSMLTQFARLDLVTQRIDHGVADTQRQLVLISDRLVDLEGGLWSSLSDGFRRPLWNRIDEALGYAERTGRPLSKADYLAADSAFYTWSTRHAFDQASTGPRVRDYHLDRIGPELSAYPLDVNINYLAALPAVLSLSPLSGQALPNPHDWVLGARAYLALTMDYPNRARLNQRLRQEIQGLASGGQALQRFEQRIRSGTAPYDGATLNPLFAALLTRYDNALDSLGEAVAGVENTFRAGIQGLDPFAGTEQDSPLWSTLSTTPCSGDNPDPTLPITDLTARRLAPGPLRILSRFDAPGHGTLNFCKTGSWEDFEERVVGHREILTAELTATLTAKWNEVPVYRQQVGLERFTLCSTSTTDPDPDPCPAYPNAAQLVGASWSTRVKPLLDARTEVETLAPDTTRTLTDQALQYLLQKQHDELMKVADGFTTDPAARLAAGQLTGITSALRAYIELGLPGSLAGDEVLSAMLRGTTRLLDEDAEQRLSQWYVRQANAVPAPLTEPWQEIATEAHRRVQGFADALAGDLAALRSGQVHDGSLATATTLQRLSTLASTALTPSASFDPATRRLTVPATSVGRRRNVPVVLRNAGLGLLRVRKVSTTGAGLSATTACTTVLGHHACTIQVRFAPTRAGAVHGGLVVITNTARGRVTLPVTATAR